MLFFSETLQKHFLPFTPFLKNTIQRTLQVPVNRDRKSACAERTEKRVSPSASRTKTDGFAASLTLEAALCLPFFLFLAVALMQPLQWLDRQRRVQTAVETVCEDLSLKFLFTETLLKKGESDEAPDPAALEAAAGLWLKGKAGVHADGIVIRKAELPDRNGNLCFEVSYPERIPFFPALRGGIVMRAAACRRPWTGKDGKLREQDVDRKEDETGEEMVYVGAGMGRYHKFRDCHYLSNRYRALPGERAAAERNASGKRYTACSRCVKGNAGNGEVYVTPEGEHYHSDRSCSAMAAYVRRVPLREVEHLGLCSYCAGRGG